MGAPTGAEVEDREEIVGVAEVTVTDAFALRPFKVAMMVVFPAPAAVANPGVELLSAATAVFEELQFTVAVKSWVLPSV